MRMKEALELINQPKPHTMGYRVSFERREGGMLIGDFVPDRDEEPIKTEDEAWTLAAQLAGALRDGATNFLVCYADDFCPVEGYKKKMIH